MTRHAAALLLLLLAIAVPAAAETTTSPITATWVAPTPADNATVSSCSIPLSVTLTDTASVVTQVMFLDMTTSRVVATVSPSNGTASYTWTTATAGTHSLRVRAVDAQNNSAMSPARTLNVTQGSGCGGTSGGSSGGGTSSNGLCTLTVNGGTGASGAGQYAAGTKVAIDAGTPPSGKEFLGWSTNGYVQFADSSSSQQTITMPASNTTVTASFTNAPSIPQPVTTHPRLWVTQSDLPRLRSWATSSNPVYANGLLPQILGAQQTYQSKFAPFFGPNPPAASSYPDPGDIQGYVGPQSEQVGMLLAFGSLIDPDPNQRATYASEARNLLMYAMNQAALGPAKDQPFRDPQFALFNRANGASEDWPLIVDWIYPSLTDTDKATIRKVFMLWSDQILHAYVPGGDHPAPIGWTNSPALLPNGKAYRMAANNYYLGHARLLTMMGLSFDKADDPAIDPNVDVNARGNSLRSYIADATGAWLYQEYAMFGDPNQVKQDYNLPSSAGLGLASGGMPPEGWLYGHSLGFLAGQMLALQTAGFADPSISGPQAKLVTAPFWRRMIDASYATLVPNQAVDPNQAYLGPIYSIASYGDLLRLWITPDEMTPFALLTQIERQTGNVDTNGTPVDDNDARYWMTNVLEGGSANLYHRMSNPWFKDEPVLYFLSMAPGSPAVTDPRPNMPTTFVDRGQGRVVSRTGWNSGATLFDYRGSWESINHQDGDAGQFELYRNGEWLTKEMSNYDNNGVGQTPAFHNSLSLQEDAVNNPPTSLGWYEKPVWQWGGQFYNGSAAGDPVTDISNGQGYTFAQSDLTKLYQRLDQFTPANVATAVKHASRSIVWVDGDYVVDYDRVSDTKPGLFKKWNIELTNQPTISQGGKVATEVTPKQQQLFVQSLMQGTLTTWNGAQSLTGTAWGEPTRWTLTDEDTSEPTDVRFLHVLQGADKGAPMVQATYRQSTAGAAFDGADFGSDTVYFAHDYNQAFSTTTLPVPPGVHTVLVTGLAPGASYGVTQGSGDVTITAAGSDATADSAGVVRLTV
jgi:hypothetical protein